MKRVFAGFIVCALSGAITAQAQSIYESDYAGGVPASVAGKVANVDGASLFAKLSPSLVRTPQPRQLSLADRVEHQRAIEEVYWRHRIWPKERRDPKPSLDEVMSRTELEQKVEDYLRNSQALEDYWQQPVTAEQMQAEMDRMAQQTRQSEVLRELFAALGNDPFVIAECLARPALSERLVTNFHAQDQSGKELYKSWKANVESKVPQLVATAVANYSLPTISDSVIGFTGDTRATTGAINGPTPTPGCIDPWISTSTADVPAGRSSHTAVWTGSEMIVWGGFLGGSSVNIGGRYNPATDSWTVTNTSNAPIARNLHTAVWTGSEMIVWGGGDKSNFNTGGRYDPLTDSWTATSTTNAPSARSNHTAVWTGSEMIVWGGGDADNFNTGGRYNPLTDSWTATSTTNAPPARYAHAAVWTGSEMIVWGGDDINGDLDTGGNYNPVTDSWTATSITNVPTGRFGPTAVWTGTQMIVWGGEADINFLNTGGRYDPGTDSWTPTSTIDAPSGRDGHTEVWTGNEMIVWGGYDGDVSNTGGRYNPLTDSWTATTTANAPVARSGHTAVWTNSEMIVWGGEDGSNFVNTGGRYCPQAPTPTPGATPTPTSSPVPETPTPTPPAGETPTPAPSPTGTPNSSPTSTPTPGPSAAQALNISTRMRVDTGSNVLIGGFIITGTASKNVAVRGIGPSLSAFGVPDALADPTLELRDSTNTVVLANDDWQSDSEQAAQLTTLHLALQDPKESGLVTIVQPGSYTAVLAGKNNGTGVGLVEVYDVSSASDSELGNISTRGFVLTDTNVMIGGFILGGANNTHVVVRGIGPSLAQFGIPNVLTDPTLELHDSNGATLVSNDNWQDDTVSAAQLTALNLGLQDTAESGIYTSLAPGAFTAILAGKNSSTGVGLLEIYNVH